MVLMPEKHVNRSVSIIREQSGSKITFVILEEW